MLYVKIVDFAAILTIENKLQRSNINSFLTTFRNYT